MITTINEFKQYLNEYKLKNIDDSTMCALNEEKITENSSVYHFTLPKYFINIIKTDSLFENNGYISFTINPDLWVFKEFTDEDQEIGVRLEFNSKDLPKLSYHNDSFFDDDLSHEQEYRTNSGDINNISNKIKSIQAFKYYQQYLLENLPKNIYNKIEFIT